MNEEECQHNYVTITNLYGKIIGEYVKNGVVYRSLKRCKICGKKIKSTELDKTCTVKNKPYLW